jgi:hypothetical protein
LVISPRRPRTALTIRLRLGGGGDPRLGASVEAALVAAAAVGLEGGVDEPVRLGREGGDLLLAAGEDGQRRRLDPAERDGAVERRAQADRRRAGGVHADDPVGLRARPGRLLERLELGGVAQVGERGVHRLLGHGLQPQPLDRLRRARLLVEVGEDELALATGVAGVDDELHVVALELPGDDRHLLLGALVAHDELEAVRHDRQIGHPPLLVLDVVLVGLGELHEMADRPRDDVLGTLQAALLLLEGSGQHAGDVAPDGRLLSDDEGLGHGGAP